MKELHPEGYGQLIEEEKQLLLKVKDPVTTAAIRNNGDKSSSFWSSIGQIIMVAFGPSRNGPYYMAAGHGR